MNSPTLAMVGERGKEAVMPLENNTGWITELAGQIVALMGFGADRNEDDVGDLVLELDGNEFGRLSLKAINRRRRKVGLPAI